MRLRQSGGVELKSQRAALRQTAVGRRRYTGGERLGLVVMDTQQLAGPTKAATDSRAREQWSRPRSQRY